MILISILISQIKLERHRFYASNKQSRVENDGCTLSFLYSPLEKNAPNSTFDLS